MSRMRALTAALAATLVLAACGSSGSTPDTPKPAGNPATLFPAALRKP